MRTTFPIVVMIAVGIMVAVLSGSGFLSAVNTGDSVDDYTADDAIEKESQNNEWDEGIGGQGRNTGNTPVDFIVSGVSMIFRVAGMVVMAPFTLSRLLFPWFWSEPLGWGFEILTIIGVYQAAMGRRWV